MPGYRPAVRFHSPSSVSCVNTTAQFEILLVREPGADEPFTV